MNNLLTKLENLNYKIGEAFSIGEDLKVYNIQGFGLSMMVRSDDNSVLESLLVTHSERVQQSKESLEETQERLSIE